MSAHIVPEFTSLTVFAAVVIALIYITLSSLVKEPDRQKLSAAIVAGAGGVYWSGGLGVWEFVFSSLLIFIAYKGLSRYYLLGIGWLMHSCWDVVHHLYGNPVVSFSPSSSAGCAVCDSILAIWFIFGAPSVFNLFKQTKTASI